jgi:hypothetical protein
VWLFSPNAITAADDLKSNTDKAAKQSDYSQNLFQSDEQQVPGCSTNAAGA